MNRTFGNDNGYACTDFFAIWLKLILLQLWQLEDNPYSYNLHMEIVKLLRKQGDLDQLRRARECMSATFPLTEGIFP